MQKFMVFLNRCLNWVLNIVVLSGIILLVVWFVWDVPPQASIVKTAQFCAKGWDFITGNSLDDKFKQPVTTEQLKESRQKMVIYYEK